jgi:hypothetical protein
MDAPVAVCVNPLNRSVRINPSGGIMVHFVPGMLMGWPDCAEQSTGDRASKMNRIYLIRID